MKQLFTVLTCLLFSMAAMSQIQHFSCTAGEMSQKLYDKNPQLLVAKDQLEAFTEAFVARAQAERNLRSGTNGIKYVIPVVFHIMHSGGPENVTDSIIYEEMLHWNQYMNMTNPELPITVPAFIGIVGNPQIEFRMAQVDPNGNCTNGIDRIYTSSANYGDETTKLNPWPREKYINVWLTKGIDKDTTDYGTLAYSEYPAAVSSYSNNDITDGILCKYGDVGTDVIFSRPTLAHECGHWMNLAHTWGNTNNPGVACGDDGVFDTPITEGDQNVDPVTEERCVPGVIENVQNIMNYANYHFMFTQGQVDRMHAALNSPISGRDSIWSATNLVVTGTSQPLTYPNPNSCAAPVADFSVSNRYICTSQNITFKDASYNADYQDRLWTFPADANITSSTDANVVINFSSPGWKSVTLQVTNANGTSQKTRTMVYVADGSAISAPYIEMFEDTNEVNANWTVLNYDNNNTYFQWYNVGHYSNGSYKVNEYNAYYNGDKDELVSPIIDLTTLSSDANTFTFDYSYATWDATHLTDSVASMAVYATNNCGASWKQLYFNEGGYNLYNAGGITTGPYLVGQPDEYWKQVTVKITPEFMNSSSVNFKIQLLSAKAANHFYVDNINIGQAVNTTGINSAGVQHVDAVNIVPNPATGQAVVILDASAATSITVTLFDMAGREVTTLYQGQLDEGTKKIGFNTEGIAKGIYMVKISDGKSFLQKRFVKM